MVASLSRDRARDNAIGVAITTAMASVLSLPLSVVAA